VGGGGGGGGGGCVGGVGVGFLLCVASYSPMAFSSLLSFHPLPVGSSRALIILSLSPFKGEHPSNPPSRKVNLVHSFSPDFFQAG